MEVSINGGSPLSLDGLFHGKSQSNSWIITRGTLSWKKELRMFCWKGIRYSNSHSPVITIFVGGMVTIPSHGWFMALFYPHYPPVNQHNYGKSPCFIGILTISMAIFNSYFDITRGYNVGPPSDVCWFINPINYSYLRTINHSEFLEL